jgi:hypothetical protein
MSSKKNLEEAKQLNEQSKQGMTNYVNTTDINSADTQEARELNSQSASGVSQSISNSSDSDLQEAIKANKKSAQNKR